MKKTDLQPVKGARDFTPNNFAKRQWLFDQMIASAASFGFEQYDSPVLESIETYKTKTSSELVDEQSYRFKDRGDREVTIRPEMTPVLARMIAGNQNNLSFPIKWFSIPVLWRYEKPQSGRLREHFQWNVDVIGSDEQISDADCIAVLCTFFQKIGLGPDKIKVHLNDKKDLQSDIEKWTGIDPKNQTLILKFIDRLPKIGVANTISDIKQNYPRVEDIEGFINYLNAANTNLSGNLKALFENLKSLKLDDYIVIDRKIVRGLDYYTSTVFEVFPTDINSRAVAGGGRYDNLVGQFSDRKLTGVGFGMGDVVIGNLLEKYDLYPKNLNSHKKLLIAALSNNALPKTLAMSQKIREKNPNLITSFYPQMSQMRDILSYGVKNEFNFLLIVGDKELSEDKYTLRELNSGHQTTDRKGAILNQIKQLSKK